MNFVGEVVLRGPQLKSARRSEKDKSVVTGCSSMLSGHFICIGSDLLSVMNGLLQLWEEPYVSSMAHQFNSSLVSNV